LVLRLLRRALAGVRENEDADRGGERLLRRRGRGRRRGFRGLRVRTDPDRQHDQQRDDQCSFHGSTSYFAAAAAPCIGVHAPNTETVRFWRATAIDAKPVSSVMTNEKARPASTPWMTIRPSARLTVERGEDRFSPLALVVDAVLSLRLISMNCGMFRFHGASIVQSPSVVQTVACTAVQRILSCPFRSSPLTAAASAMAAPAATRIPNRFFIVPSSPPRENGETIIAAVRLPLSCHHHR